MDLKSDPKRPIVRIREDGMIEPLTRRSEMMLEARPGLLHVVAASPEVFVLRRIGEKAGDAPDEGRRVLLAGELAKKGGLAQVLDVVIGAEWTGELVVTASGVSRTLFLREQVLVGALSSSPDERIGAVMVRMGVLDVPQVDAVRARLSTGKRFGELAVELGFLSRETLFAVMRRQVEDIVASGFGVEDGVFVFIEGIDPGKVFARRHLEVREVIATVCDRLASPSADGGSAAPGRAFGGSPVSWFNAAMLAIEAVAEQVGTLQTLRAALRAHVADSPDSSVRREVFASLTEHGTLDPQRAAEAFARLGVKAPQKDLHEYLVYALFLACAGLTPEFERALLGAVERPLAALAPPPVVRSSGPRSQRAAAVEPPARYDPRRIGTAAVLVLSTMIATWVVFSVLQVPVGGRWIARFRPPPGASPIAVPAVTVVPPQSSIVFAPTVAPAAHPSVVSSEAAPSPTSPNPSSTRGTIHTRHAGAFRVWIDGKLVGQTPRSFEVGCGHHVVRVGSTGQPQLVEVPCGGEIEVGSNTTTHAPPSPDP